MKKCRQAITDPTCNRDCCCFYCEEVGTCEHACSRDEENGCEEQFDEETALQEFNNNALAVMKSIAAISNQKKELEEQEKKIREDLEAAMEQYGIKSFENDILKVTYVAPTTKTTVDSAKLKKNYPNIFSECSKTSDVKASIRITVK
ncbi:MAG: hypothetical protein IKW21_00395 [Lachnospiraceae bacterium]|nr:hypothetical protein [Lachnospiraceae bacterium]